MRRHLGGRAEIGHALVELARVADQIVRTAVRPAHGTQIAVGNHLRIVPQFAHALHRCPGRVEGFEFGDPVGQIVLLEGLPDLRHAGLGVLAAHLGVQEAGGLDQVRPAQVPAELRPMAVGLEHHQGDPTSIARRVHGREGVLG